MAVPSSATNSRKRLRWSVALVLLLATGLVLVGLRVRSRFNSPPTDPSLVSGQPSDPRLAYDGPYRNIHPEVRYVGDAQCAGACHVHDDILQSYARHPMARSLVAAEQLLERQRYTPDTNNPFEILGRSFEVQRQGKQLWHRQELLDSSGKPLVELAQEVHWVIGSGAKGYSYLTERGGYLLQTPISWFTQQQRWDLSPGFGPQVLTGRLVPGSCLFCHANRVLEDPEQPDHFLAPVFDGESIGCERCHGPGGRHVQSADRWDIVNPGRLAPPLRDAVCEQCHLEGEARIVRAGRKLFDYRPGLALSDFWAVLVQGRQSGEDAKAVNHVEQMYQSKCFSRPVGERKMGCITCHDPHVALAPRQRESHYRAQCLKCHDDSSQTSHDPKVPGCSETRSRRKETSPEDSCITCHMPRYRSSDIAHTASTDHRIVRQRSRQPISLTDLDRAVFVDFYRDRFPQGDSQNERNLGLGLVKMMKTSLIQPQHHADRALRLLESALARDASDLFVREGKVEAYLLLNRPAEALNEAEVLLSEQGSNWQFLAKAAYAAQADGQLERARDYWQRVVAINPFVPDYQSRLVDLLIRTGQVDEAQKRCERLLRLDPFNLAGQQVRVGFLLQSGKQAEAKRAFEVIRRLKPPNLDEREKWFEEQLHAATKTTNRDKNP